MTHSQAPRRASTIRALLIASIACCASLTTSAHAAQVVIDGPAGSGEFGRSVTILPNGNIVVADPGFDAPGPVANVGAVYLYLPNGRLVSALRGSTANDHVGIGDIVVLPSGNYIVFSPDWSNGASTAAGAVTFGSAISGISGVLSAANSLVGSRTDDRVGSHGATILANGNYVVQSIFWRNGTAASAGAATFGSGEIGISGEVSPSNSLVGASAYDLVGLYVTALTNGNYVATTGSWSNASMTDVGAATFGSGTFGVSGIVSAANSLVGTRAFDNVGLVGATALSNGNYVVASRLWNNGSIEEAGAVTFGSGKSGIIGAVSPTNSLVGTSPSDQVGGYGATALTNGNYVVTSLVWDNGSVPNVGAVTFASGIAGITGPVSPSNSLIGTNPGDQVGWLGATALSNGNYVVASGLWNNGAINNAGAVTFGSGTTGITGVVSPANSLVGTTFNDYVGLDGVTTLANGNYVVQSPSWNGAQGDVGAATFGSGTTGISGAVSPLNSLVGSSLADNVGNLVTALTNGNYVVTSSWANGAATRAGAATFGSGTIGVSGVVSPSNSLVGSSTGDSVGSATGLVNGNYVVSSFWDTGTIANVGAATFGSGTSGITGAVSPANSLIGTSIDDYVGGLLSVALANGNYLVRASDWDNGGVVDAGAVAFGSGAIGISGVVSPANALVGSSAFDQVGSPTIVALSNGNYVVSSHWWDNGATPDAGAITLGLGDGGSAGPITDAHSVLGLVANRGSSQVFSYDAHRNQLAVGQPASTRVVLHRTGAATSTSIVSGTPDPSISGQPVIFTASVSATPGAPTNGQVTFTASSGESCIDTTPSATSATTAEFSCTMALVAIGTSTVIAEYTGSVIHAYSGSAPETHTTIADVMFGNGFESP